MTNPSCDTCRFAWPAIAEDSDEVPILQCRRFPPIVYGADGEHCQSFPQMCTGEWCGEYSEVPTDG